MHDQRDDGDDEEEMNQSSCDVEGQPGEDPCEKEDDEEGQEERVEHGGSLFGLLEVDPLREQSVRDTGAILLACPG